jgi:hypothetical protein
MQRVYMHAGEINDVRRFKNINARGVEKVRYSQCSVDTVCSSSIQLGQELRFAVLGAGGT